jgi:hypothetical protein
MRLGDRNTANDVIVWEGVKRLSAVRIPNLTATRTEFANEWDCTQPVRMLNMIGRRTL